MSPSTARRGHASSPGTPPPRRLRAFLIIGLFVAAVAGAAIAGWQFARESKPVAGPIVLVTIDGLRADHLRAYGYTAGATPNLDGLATSSVVFERAYAHAPLTLPAHASLFTGRLPFRHQVRDDMGYALADDAATLAAQLSGRGFDTGAAVSSWLLRPGTGIGRGFEQYDTTLAPARADHAPPRFDPPVPLERNDWDTGVVAAEWLKRQRSDRLFYWLHLRGPAAQAVTSASNRPAAYDAAITVADAAVGAILAAIRERGWFDQSLIVVTGSHGHALGEHERSHGLTLSDAVVQVPLLVKMPEGDGSRRVAEPVQHVDLLPTLLDLVRAPMPGGLDGRSLRGVLEDALPLAPRPIYVEAMYTHVQFGGAPQQALLYRGAGEASAVATAPPPEAAQREALAAMLKGTTIAPPAWVSGADRLRFAALGHAAFGADLRLAGAGDFAPEVMAGTLDAFANAMRIEDGSRRLEVLRQLASTHPEVPQLGLELAVRLQQAGRGEDAVAVLRALAARLPERAEPPVALGRLLADLGRPAEAQKAWQGAVALPDVPGPVVGIALEGLARLAVARGDAETARANAESAVAADPAVPVIAFIDGRLKQEAGDAEAALAAFDAAVEASRTAHRRIDDLAWRRGDVLAGLDRIEDAERAYREAIAERPHDARPFVSLATLYRATHKDVEAAVAVDALMHAVPTAAGYAQAASLWQALGDTERADATRAAARARFGPEPAGRPPAR